MVSANHNVEKIKQKYTHIHNNQTNRRNIRDIRNIRNEKKIAEINEKIKRIKKELIGIGVRM